MGIVTYEIEGAILVLGIRGDKKRGLRISSFKSKMVHSGRLRPERKAHHSERDHGAE
jgi:hypothetical protein